MSRELAVATPLSEHWGVYELEPGLKVWLRIMLPYVESYHEPNLRQQLRIAPVIVAEADENFRLPKGSVPPPARTVARTYESPVAESEAESMYRMPNGVLLRVQARPVRARRFNTFQLDGYPEIEVQHEVRVETLSPAGTPTPKELVLESAVEPPSHGRGPTADKTQTDT
jgi:hypothetical protein